ncbi:MAG TPA: hypothetical protein ACFYEF_02960 [Candidatus Wunengus sp. YC63]
MIPISSRHASCVDRLNEFFILGALPAAAAPPDLRPGDRLAGVRCA